jgi:hypothetical protein
MITLCVTTPFEEETRVINSRQFRQRNKYAKLSKVTVNAAVGGNPPLSRLINRPLILQASFWC